MAFSLKDASGNVLQFLSSLVSGANLPHHGVDSISDGSAGGALTYRNINLSVTGQIIKASAGRIYGGVLCNNAAAARFVKIYDKATAPTGSDTPLLTIELPL